MPLRVVKRESDAAGLEIHTPGGYVPPLRNPGVRVTRLSIADHSSTCGAIASDATSGCKAYVAAVAASSWFAVPCVASRPSVSLM